jgi:hypothetical protein
VQMWTLIREVLIFLCFLGTLFAFTYMNVDPNGFRQVDHLRKFLLDSRSGGNDFGQVCTSRTFRSRHSISNIIRSTRSMSIGSGWTRASSTAFVHSAGTTVKHREISAVSSMTK